MVLKELEKKPPDYSVDDDGVYYDQYGFNPEGLNKNGFDIYGFNKDGFNKHGLNKDGLNKLGKGLNISTLPILLPKINTNNSSKELIKNIKQLINNLYNNELITKQVYNNLIKAIMSTTFIKADS